MRALLVAAALLAPAAAFAQGAQILTPLQTIAFEDVADDGTSDEDHNDLGVRYRRQCNTDGSGRLIRDRLHLAAVSAGAAHDNGLAWDLPADALSVELRRGTDPPQELFPDPAGRVVLLESFRDAFVTPGSVFVNTDPEAVIRSGLPIEVVVTYATATAAVVGGSCPIPQLVLVPPVDVSLPAVTLGSTIGPNDRPLAGNFTGDWEVPAERVSIVEAYPDFLCWVDGCPGTTVCEPETWFDCPVEGLVVGRPSLDDEASIAPFPSCSDGVQNGGETGVDCGVVGCGDCPVWLYGMERNQGGALAKVWRFGDANGDGDMSDAAEAVLLYTFPTSAGGTAAVPGDGGDLYVLVGNDVYRLFDANADHVYQSSEVTLFADPVNNVADIVWDDGTLWGVNWGSSGHIHRFTDNNADGDALDAGEYPVQAVSNIGAGLDRRFEPVLGHEVLWVFSQRWSDLDSNGTLDRTDVGAFPPTCAFGEVGAAADPRGGPVYYLRNNPGCAEVGWQEDTSGDLRFYLASERGLLGNVAITNPTGLVTDTRGQLYLFGYDTTKSLVRLLDDEGTWSPTVLVTGRELRGLHRGPDQLP